MSVLAASGTSAESVRLTAPSSAGTYYYGACVDTVSGETATANNCSSAVRVTVSSSGGGSDDHGNTRSGATSLSLGSSRSGRIETGSDVDYFRVRVSGSGTLTVYTTGSLDTQGELQSSSGSTLTSNDDGGSGRNFRIQRSVSAGTYYIKVESYSSRTGSYTVHASFDSSTSTQVGEAVSGTITSCSGTRDSFTGLVTVSISGNVSAHRSVSFLTVTAYANGQFVGIDNVGSLSAGQSRSFSVGGLLTSSGTSLRCSASLDWTEFSS